MKGIHNFIGPYIIKKKINSVNFEIDLPPTYISYPVVYLCYLRKFKELVSTAQATLLEPILMGGEERYVVIYIVKRKTHGRKTEYLVKWRGYDTS